METWLKSPGAVLDYAVNWKLQPGDAIKESAWVIPHGLTKVKDSLSGNVATIWLSGGKMNNRFTIINRIKTTAGRKPEKYVSLIIGAK